MAKLKNPIILTVYTKIVNCTTLLLKPKLNPKV